MKKKLSTNYDTTANANILLRAKGPGRTMRAFADVTNINKSTLSRIANQQYFRPLSSDLIAKIYGARADENDTSLLSDLLRANGFLSHNGAEELALTFADAAESTKLCSMIKGVFVNYLLSKGISVEKEVKFSTSYELVRKKLAYAITDPYILQIRSRDGGSTRYLRVVPSLRTKKDKPHSLLDTLYPFFLEDSCYPEELSDSETIFVFTAKEDIQSFLSDGGDYRWHHSASAALIDIRNFAVIDLVALPKIGIIMPI